MDVCMEVALITGANKGIGLELVHKYGGACRRGHRETGSHERCGICRDGIGSGGV